MRLWSSKSKPKIRSTITKTIIHTDLHHYQNNHHHHHRHRQQLQLLRLTAPSPGSSLAFPIIITNLPRLRLANVIFVLLRIIHITFDDSHSPSPISSLASSIPPPNIIEASRTIHHRRWWWWCCSKLQLLRLAAHSWGVVADGSWSLLIAVVDCYVVISSIHPTPPPNNDNDYFSSKASRKAKLTRSSHYHYAAAVVVMVVDD